MTHERGWRRLFGRRKRAPLDRERTDLVVVVRSLDDAESCGTALERGAASAPVWRQPEEAVLRHHLRLPGGAVDGAVALAGQDGYTVAAAPADVPGDGTTDGLVAVTLQRTQVLDALHCSQERSRMASLAQRAGGTVLGWDALQPPPEGA